MIDAKVFDVDDLKKLYVNSAKRGLISDPKKGEYDFNNPDDVQALHGIVKAKGYKDTRNKIFLDIENLKKNRLPNVIYDITGKDIKDLVEISGEMRGKGYKISLVWVVANRDVALVQNLIRGRTVPQDRFHFIHNEVMTKLPEFITLEAGRYFDECWILFSTTKKIPQLMTKGELKELKDDRAFKLSRNGKGFEMDDKLKERLFDILGDVEENPNDPKTYRNFATVKKDLQSNPVPKMPKKPDIKQFFKKS